MDSGVPRLLPGDEPGFLNRGREIDAFRRLVVGTGPVAVEGPGRIWLTGPPGIGKTTLAVRLGNLFETRFTDGILYADLRGSTPDNAADVADVLRHFLRQLGKEPAEIPGALDELAADFRSHTANRAILVVLDDARTSAQVRPLLPSSPDAVVLVTSRRHLDGLVYSGFSRIELENFTTDDAIRLVRGIVGAERFAAEPAAGERLVNFCSGLPLALRVVAARILARRTRSLAALVDQITKAPFEHLRLEGDAPVEAVFDASFADLDEEQRRAYCLLGQIPAAEFDLAAAAAVLDRSISETNDLVDDLDEAYLVRRADDRVAIHSLVREHARARAEAADLEPRAARLRAVGWYLRRAAALSKNVSRRWSVSARAEAIDPAYDGDDAYRPAAAELERDDAVYPAIAALADELSLDQACAELGEALQPWYYNTDRTSHLLAVLRLAVPAADALGDVRLSMRLHHDLGSAHEKAKEFPAALREFERAMGLAQECGDRLGEASAVEWSGLVLRQVGDHASAVDRFERAREILRTGEIENREHRERALVLLSLHRGTDLVALGHTAEADAELRDALEWFHDRGEVINEARALLALAPISGDQARPTLERALELFAAGGLRSKQIDALVALAELDFADGEQAAAVGRLREARELARQIGLWSVVESLDERLARHSV
ncbi:tetratricopeptide repeat protein [Actinokineospora auranticolor]|uniref:NB-ARC domain-containing protein n=1 Tax=Actinokineospora auranticolor TaxID=155976 RepID=UPI0035A96C8E